MYLRICIQNIENSKIIILYYWLRGKYMENEKKNFPLVSY